MVPLQLNDLKSSTSIYRFMNVNNELVDKIAELAKLEFDEATRESIKTDLSRILEFVDKLEELDTEQIEPLVYMTEEQNRLRVDEVKMEITQQEALKNAPKKDSDYFKVPKVLDK